MEKINKLLTPYNYTPMSNKSNLWIVIHYVGAVSSAKANANYFYNNKLQASANYFVDENEIWQIVEDKDRAWHVGAKKYYNNCRNNNSIGIEMCCKKAQNGNWYIEPRTIDNTIELTKELMQKYNIDNDHVVRHYDVTRKVCPEPFVRNPELWNEFKSRLEEKKMFDDEYKALDYLVEKGKITDKDYWTCALKVVKNLKFLIIKYANDILGK